MLNKRLIPILSIKDKSLVKTENFNIPRYVGDPINAVKIFNEKFVDEILLIDIGASKNNFSPNFNLIEKISNECFVPLTYGGGISCFEDVKKIFRLGIEKISLQNILFKKENLVTEIKETYGSQSIVASIDIKKNIFGKYQIFDYINNSLRKNLDLVYFIENLVKLGVGEVLINNVTNDGRMNGLDQNIIKLLSGKFDIPIIFCGGLSNLKNIKTSYGNGATAIAAGAFFVFYGPHKAVLINYPSKKELEKLYE